ncbi:MAG: hypothetical protein ABIG37_00590 [Nanoarchaeota archaeon]|nr:hypothetical protein [Nanoarchaeota archaeon]
MKLEDIVFWFLILGIIAIALWMLHGSPTEASAIIAVSVFVATSEILIWKTIFEKDKSIFINFEKLDKKTSISFEKLKNEINTQFNQLNIKLEKLIKK